MEDYDVLDLAWQVLPWVSNQAIILGQQTLNNVYGKLGTELFILAQYIPTMIDDVTVREKVTTVLGLVNKACSTTTSLESRNDSFGTLRTIQKYNESSTSVRASVDEEIRSSLTYFVKTDPEFHTLLHLIQDCLISSNESLTGQLEGKSDIETDDMEYPARINDILYDQLRMHACCKCSNGHLKWTQLRLNTNDKQKDTEIKFELLFQINSNPLTDLDSRDHNYKRWKETVVLVSRRNGKKQLSFKDQPSRSVQSLQSGLKLSRKLRRIGLGDFCNMINAEINDRLYLHIQANIMNVIEENEELDCPRVLSSSELSLENWLRDTPHVSNKGKVALAYTLARSAWQYYDSLWMMTPWTHETICLLGEKSITKAQRKPHPYLTRQLIEVVENRVDFYIAEDLMFPYPHILALGILLIEIAIKAPFKDKQHPYVWNETTVNDYYTWAWITANRCDLKQSVHPIYEEVVNNCLDAELFGTSPSQEYSTETSLKTRKRLLYEKVVSPLKRLHEAYQDDWEIEPVPMAFSSAVPTAHNQSTEIPDRIATMSRDQFTVAILCALPLEIDAVSSLFDEFWDENTDLIRNAPNDSNAYTIGRMGAHMVVLVHMPSMGKSAASQSAASLQSTFPNIKLALVVGICGGVPYYGGQREIILGDVVISDGIVQYDFGRRLPGAFHRKTSMPETLGRPNVAIRSLLAKIKTRRIKERLANKMPNNLQAISNNLGGHSAQYPSIHHDELFQSNYIHKHYNPGVCATCDHCQDSTDPVCDNVSDLTCEQLGCQKGKLVSRERLNIALEVEKPPNPIIHIGLVGSGDTVMKSGLDRDKIAARDTVIAFEMEGAGVWDILPCIVIKGVCDYADSHKNKVWQQYAAATGAACMRAVLDEWSI